MKIKFDIPKDFPQKLEKSLLKAAEEQIKKDGVDLTCSTCEKKITVKGANLICKYCGTKFDLNL